MPIQLDTQALYLPKVGTASLKQGMHITLGFILVTDTHLYYVPQMNYKVTDMGDKEQYEDVRVKGFDGVKFYDVVPAAAQKLGTLADLNKLVTEMAEGIRGSYLIPLTAIESFKTGFFSGFQVFSGGNKVRFNVSLGHQKKVRQFLGSRGKQQRAA